MCHASLFSSSNEAIIELKFGLLYSYLSFFAGVGKESPRGCMIARHLRESRVFANKTRCLTSCNATVMLCLRILIKLFPVPNYSFAQYFHNEFGVAQR